MVKAISKVEFFRLSKELSKQHFRVAIFGSARIKENSKYYKEIHHLAKMLGQRGIDVVTGGGPGIMRAANEGHQEGRKNTPNNNNTKSFGLTIRLPKEQKDNRHFDMKKDFKVFSRRLDYFVELSNAVVVAPGGVGTLLEFLYTWQLVQVEHIYDIPIIMIGEQWKPLLEWIRMGPMKHKLIGPRDIDSIFYVKNAKEAMKIIDKARQAYNIDGKEYYADIKRYRETLRGRI